MKDQQYLRFPPEVNAILTGTPSEAEGLVLPLFRELSPEEEDEFRKHARENYVPGDPIKMIFHPIWREEACRINEEAGIISIME